MNLDILYQDEHIVAVNKPAGMLVHRSALDRHETTFLLQELRNAVDCHVYPVHRLDKPTSGVIVFAKSSDVAQKLQHQLSPEQGGCKSYLLVCRGYTGESGIIDHPLKPLTDFKRRGKMPKSSVTKEAKEAVTEYQRLATVELPISVDRYPCTRYSLVSATLNTGRKHQLRRHFKHISHPIVGCPKYGKSSHNRFFADSLGVSRLLLHAHSLAFFHPVSQQRLALVAPLDSGFQSVCDQFQWSATIKSVYPN